MDLIRCDYCGWENNPADAVKCQKCNQDLVKPLHEPKITPDMFVTVRREESVMPDCKNCGYPLTPDISFCPNCGTPTGVKPQVVSDALKATIRDVSLNSINRIQDELHEHQNQPFPVEPISAQSQPDEPVSKPILSVNPALNRTIRIGDEPAPVPAATKKIDSSYAAFRLKPLDADSPETFAFGGECAASFEFDNGDWYIVDESGKQSAFVSASRRIVLEPGDVILLGGRKYIFG